MRGALNRITHIPAPERRAGVDGDVLAFSGLARHPDPNQPFYGVRALGLDGEPLARLRVMEEATAAIRGRVPGALVHIETTGSDPDALRRAVLRPGFDQGNRRAR